MTHQWTEEDIQRHISGQLKQFSFGRDDAEVGRELREVWDLETALFTPKGGLYLHKLLFFLEGQLTKEIPDTAPPEIRRLDVLYTRYQRTEDGAWYHEPMGFAEYDGVWFIMASSQGPILVGCNTDQEGLDAIMAKEPWEGCEAASLFGYGGKGVRGYGRNP